MEKHVFTVDNMTCNGCVANIRQSLEADQRIQSIDIQLSRKRVTVEGDINSQETAEIIRQAGYHPEEGSKSKGLLGGLFSR